MEQLVIVCFQLDETKRLHSMQLEELEKRTSQLQMEADGLMKAQQALYVSTRVHCVTVISHVVLYKAQIPLC